MFNKKIAIIGSGNVASHLVEVFFEQKLDVTEIYSRNTEEAEKIATAFRIPLVKNLKDVGKNADIIFLAVSDDAIEEVCNNLSCTDKIIAHCSGIANTELLKVCTNNYACFYPLQTFTKNHKVDFSQIPILITASNSETENILKDLANKISLKVAVISDIRDKVKISEDDINYIFRQ